MCVAQVPAKEMKGGEARASERQRDPGEGPKGLEWPVRPEAEHPGGRKRPHSMSTPGAGQA